MVSARSTFFAAVDFDIVFLRCEEIKKKSESNEQSYYFIDSLICNRTFFRHRRGRKVKKDCMMY